MGIAVCRGSNHCRPNSSSAISASQSCNLIQSTAHRWSSLKRPRKDVAKGLNLPLRHPIIETLESRILLSVSPNPLEMDDERDTLQVGPSSFSRPHATEEAKEVASTETGGETQFRDSTSTITFNGTNATQEYQEISGFLQNMSFARQPHCDRDGNLQWPGEGLHRRNLTSDGILYMEWELKGCISFFSENDQHDRENTTCCESTPNSGNYVVCIQ